MNDDSLIGEVASGVAGEFSKFGKSITSQVKGSTPADTQNTDSSNQITGFGKAITGQIFGANPESAPKPKSTPQPASFLDELKKMGRSVTAQVSNSEDFNKGQVAEMAKKDEDFSKQEADVYRSRIARIYQEYQAKKRQDEEKRKQILVQEEQKKQEADAFMQEKKDRNSPNAAIDKSRAEIKNYGAE